MAQVVAATSSSIEVRGSCAAMTDRPSACSIGMTLFQLDASVQAPCTKTIVAAALGRLGANDAGEEALSGTLTRRAGVLWTTAKKKGMVGLLSGVVIKLGA
jgi:hypothetical protein